MVHSLPPTPPHSPDGQSVQVKPDASVLDLPDTRTAIDLGARLDVLHSVESTPPPSPSSTFRATKASPKFEIPEGGIVDHKMLKAYHERLQPPLPRRLSLIEEALSIPPRSLRGSFNTEERVSVPANVSQAIVETPEDGVVEEEAQPTLGRRSLRFKRSNLSLAAISSLKRTRNRSNSNSDSECSGARNKKLPRLPAWSPRTSPSFVAADQAFEASSQAPVISSKPATTPAHQTLPFRDTRNDKSWYGRQAHKLASAFGVSSPPAPPVRPTPTGLGHLSISWDFSTVDSDGSTKSAHFEWNKDMGFEFLQTHLKELYPDFPFPYEAVEAHESLLRLDAYLAQSHVYSSGEALRNHKRHGS